MKVSLLHVWAQEMWHEEVFIIGNNDGLQQLRDVIGEALKGISAKTDGRKRPALMTNDGEGFTVHVICDDKSDWNAKDGAWAKRAVPYTHESAKENRAGAIFPWDEIKKE